MECNKYLAWYGSGHYMKKILDSIRWTTWGLHEEQQVFKLICFRNISFSLGFTPLELHKEQQVLICFRNIKYKFCCDFKILHYIRFAWIKSCKLKRNSSRHPVTSPHSDITQSLLDSSGNNDLTCTGGVDVHRSISHKPPLLTSSPHQSNQNQKFTFIC